MLDSYLIVTRGGVVLFRHDWVSGQASALETAYAECLLKAVLEGQGRTLQGVNEFGFNQFILKWSLDNPTDLIFIAVYQKMLPLIYVDSFLQRSITDFCCLYSADNAQYDSFSDTMLSLYADQVKRSKPADTAVEDKVAEKSPSKVPAPNKKARKWAGQVSKEEAKALDYSQSGSDTFKIQDQFIDSDAMNKIAKGRYVVPEMEKKVSDKSSMASGWMSFFKSFTGDKVLSREDLDPIIKSMKEHLVQKNVAKEISDRLCDSVLESLVGTKVGAFENISKKVRSSLESIVRNILTPRTSIDILRDVQLVIQKEKRPFVITFVGVNGVGKSTNLSKVCFWLLQNGHKILIAACDTFRSGAVEQLRVHVKNLRALDESIKVEIFERGYGKDPAGIAAEAITYAKKEGFDIVLIDTAGRMQDNEPLMRSLSKLVVVNNPDKIIFVGEALVGNEAVDQLAGFNRALRDFSGKRDPRQIDGIILSKFDTVDDKVGAALSMTYVTGQPILFVGTGQTYTDLRRMNISQIVDTLID